MIKSTKDNIEVIELDESDVKGLHGGYQKFIKIGDYVLVADHDVQFFIDDILKAMGYDTYSDLIATIIDANLKIEDLNKELGR